MKNKTYKLILILICLSIFSVLGMQFYWLKSQYSLQKESLERNIDRVLSSFDLYLRDELNSRATIDAQSQEELDFYFESKDSIIEFLIEDVVRKRNFDGSLAILDTQIYDRRIEQFKGVLQEIVSETEETRSEETDPLTENFIILYGQENRSNTVKKSWSSIISKFAVDSFFRTELSASGIDLMFEYGVRNTDDNAWDYLSSPQDSSLIYASKFKKVVFGDEETIYLHVNYSNSYLLSKISRILWLSTILIALVLLSFFYMLSMIWKQKNISEMKNDFINNMTHEFKTPIATIDFALANINNPSIIKDEAQIRQFTHIIAQENKRMNTQVEKVLTAASSDKRSFDLELGMIELDDFLRGLIASFRMQMEAAGMSFNLVSGACNGIVMGDNLHLRNAIANVIENAIKYSPDGGEILISCNKKDGVFRLNITDQGIGMTKESQSRIFDKFYRVSTGNLHNIKGFGLGLNYSQVILRLHGGEVRVESKLGKGSTFIIEIPLKD